MGIQLLDHPGPTGLIHSQMGSSSYAPVPETQDPGGHEPDAIPSHVITLGVAQPPYLPAQQPHVFQQYPAHQTTMHHNTLNTIVTAPTYVYNGWAIPLFECGSPGNCKPPWFDLRSGK
jgi:hypothetical protein